LRGGNTYLVNKTVKVSNIEVENFQSIPITLYGLEGAGKSSVLGTRESAARASPYSFIMKLENYRKRVKYPIERDLLLSSSNLFVTAITHTIGGYLSLSDTRCVHLFVLVIIESFTSSTFTTSTRNPNGRGMKIIPRMRLDIQNDKEGLLLLNLLIPRNYYYIYVSFFI